VLRHNPSVSTTGQLLRQTTGGISYLERPGVGETLVILHGIGSNSDSFVPLLKGFPPGPRLLAWDAPGYLLSNPLEMARPSTLDYAEALGRFLDNLGVRSVHLVGHSLGTLIAVAFTQFAPERVATLTLASSAQGHGRSKEDTLADNARQRLDQLSRLGPADFAEARAPRLIFQPEQNPSNVARVREEMARINPDGYAQAVHMLSTGDLAASVAGVSIQPGFIIGAEDQITPMAQTEAAMSAWASAHGKAPRCIVIPKAGHAVYVQAQPEFTDAVMTLTRGLQPETLRYAEGDLHDQ